MWHKTSLMWLFFIYKMSVPTGFKSDQTLLSQNPKIMFSYFPSVVSSNANTSTRSPLLNFGHHSEGKMGFLVWSLQDLKMNVKASTAKHQIP